MFSHFIYFIVALFILSFYEPPEELPITALHSVFSFIGISILYWLYTYALFSRLIKKIGKESPVKLDRQFSQLSTRCAVLALVVLAIDVWWLHFPAFLKTMRLFSTMPTLSSLLLLILFVGYLSLLWSSSYPAHKAIYHTDISRRNYVFSNIAFSVPVLIPWTLLFGIHDIIRLLPFDMPKALLNSAIGQTVYFLIFLMIAAIFAPVLVQRFWRCRPLEQGPHRARIEALCKKAGVRYADIVYWPIFGGRMITAAVMGLVARFRYILVTEALLSILTPDEIDQVVAHEIGHVKHKHLILYLLFFIGFLLISYTVFPLTHLILYSNDLFFSAVHTFQLNPNKLGEIVGGIIFLACIITYFRYIFGYFIRNFERQADLYVFQLFSSARPLISTFDKITASSGQPADKPNWHHFSIQQRIDYLWRCENSPQWISKHSKKVTKSIAVFVVSFIFLGLAAYQLNKAVHDNRQSAIVEAIEVYLEKKPMKTIDDAKLYDFLGNTYLDGNKVERAVSAYEASLELIPDNPDTLNNLSWVLATSTNNAVYDPPRALELATKAITIKKAPHIWDTLAESLFANGRIEEAIAAERNAIAMNPEDLKIYQKQLEKFEKVLNEL